MSVFLYVCAKFEKKAESYMSTASASDDVIDLPKLFFILWGGRWVIVTVTLVFAVVGIVFALSLPNQFKSKGVYAPAQKEVDGNLPGQFGGLAAMAGINLGGGNSNDIDQAMELVLSWAFLEKVVYKYELKPLVMGVNGWDQEADELLWDEDVYDAENKKWVRNPPSGMVPEPSSFEVYEKLKEMIEVNYDTKVGMVNISVQYFSPSIAKEWVDILVAELNSHFQVRDVLKASRNIEYLENKIEGTSIAGMQEVLYGMIEAQTKTLMLAEVSGDYLLECVVEPKAAEKHSSPKRALMVFLFVFLGGMLAVTSVFVRGLLKSSKVG